jgi:hypothetical protein
MKLLSNFSAISKYDVINSEILEFFKVILNLRLP